MTVFRQEPDSPVGFDEPITMSVSGNDLSFTTCHMCEAKWWYRDGEAVPLRSVVDGVLSRKP